MLSPHRAGCSCQLPPHWPGCIAHAEPLHALLPALPLQESASGSASVSHYCLTVPRVLPSSVPSPRTTQGCQIPPAAATPPWLLTKLAPCALCLLRASAAQSCTPHRPAPAAGVGICAWGLGSGWLGCPRKYWTTWLGGRPARPSRVAAPPLLLLRSPCHCSHTAHEPCTAHAKPSVPVCLPPSLPHPLGERRVSLGRSPLPVQCHALLPQPTMTLPPTHTKAPALHIAALPACRLPGLTPCARSRQRASTARKNPAPPPCPAAGVCLSAWGLAAAGWGGLGTSVLLGWTGAWPSLV